MADCKSGRTRSEMHVAFLFDIIQHGGQAALPVAPDTAASIVGDLSCAEAAMPGSFVGFQGTLQLYTVMLDRRGQQASLKAASAGANALSGLYRRAKVMGTLIGMDC
jgi:hypothetical protein